MVKNQLASEEDAGHQVQSFVQDRSMENKRQPTPVLPGKLLHGPEESGRLQSTGHKESDGG